MEWDISTWTQNPVEFRAPRIIYINAQWFKVLLNGTGSHWLPGSTVLPHPSASTAHRENRKPGICQELSSWKAQHPPTMETALLRRGKGSNHRILRKLNQEFLFQGEPSVTAEL